MLVKLPDGSFERREIDYFSTVNHRYYPVLKEGESLVWSIGSQEPLIIQTPRPL